MTEGRHDRTPGSRVCDQPPGTRTKTWEIERSYEDLVMVGWDMDVGRRTIEWTWKTEFLVLSTMGTDLR
jgi:hypothetical protein